MMKIYRKFILLLSIIFTCILLYYVVITFAKYATSIQQTTDFTVARWNIKVNNVSIQNSQTTSFTIQPVFPGNSHIANNIIAPTAEGYFTLALDFTDVDVSFKYEIDVEPNTNSSVSDLIVTGYSIDNGSIITFDPEDGIGNTIAYNSGVNTQNVTIYIRWDDSNNASMNNIEDTLATLSSANDALLDVNVSFIQTTQ